MADPINLQIIDALSARLAIIRTVNGFNTDIGTTRYRMIENGPASSVPCCKIFLADEDRTPRVHGKAIPAWVIKIEGLQAYNSATEEAVDAALLMQADLEEVVFGYYWTVPFTSGGTAEIITGMTLVGAASAATAYVQSVTLSSGTWAGGDAAGTFTLRRKTGTFTSENLNISGGATNQATIATALSSVSPITALTAGLAENIIITEIGMVAPPVSDASIIGVRATIEISYKTVIGDPYHQTK